MFKREEDGRWLAEAPAAICRPRLWKHQAEAEAHAVSLALRVIADRIENGEPLPAEARGLFAAWALGERPRLAASSARFVVLHTTIDQ